MSTDLIELIESQNLTLNTSDLMEDSTLDQYLTFMLDEEKFAANILRVQEIRGWEKPTLLPNAPNYVKGVLNLRGTVVPIIDLRLRFSYENVDYSKTTVVIIFKNHTNGKEKLMGCVVDAVSDVFNLNESDIKDAPDFGTHVDSGFVKGLTTHNDEVVTILDLNTLLDLRNIEHPFTHLKDVEEVQ